MCLSASVGQERRPRGYWQDADNRKAFMDNLARSKLFDASTSDGWAGVTVRDVREAGGRSLLAHYGDSLSRLLRSVYPEMDLSACSWSGKRMRMQRGYWQKQENRRAFMNKLAKVRAVDSD